MNSNLQTIGLVMTVYRDQELARRCLTSCREVYPEARIHLISDGDDDPCWPDVARQFAASYERGKHYFDVQSGGRYTERLLRAALDLGTSHVLRIDTDTLLHRRLTWLPSGCVFGSLQRSGGLLGVQGGCTGLCADVLPHLLEREYLDALQDYRSWAVTWLLRKRAELLGFMSWDWSVAYLCQRAGVPVRAHHEIGSHWQRPPLNDNGRFAVTHPHKISRAGSEATPQPYPGWWPSTMSANGEPARRMRALFLESCRRPRQEGCPAGSRLLGMAQDDRWEIKLFGDIRSDDASLALTSVGYESNLDPLARPYVSCWLRLIEDVPVARLRRLSPRTLVAVFAGVEDDHLLPHTDVVRLATVFCMAVYHSVLHVAAKLGTALTRAAGVDAVAGLVRQRS